MLITKNAHMLPGEEGKLETCDRRITAKSVEKEREKLFPLHNHAPTHFRPHAHTERITNYEAKGVAACSSLEPPLPLLPLLPKQYYANETNAQRINNSNNFLSRLMGARNKGGQGWRWVMQTLCREPVLRRGLREQEEETEKHRGRR